MMGRRETSQIQFLYTFDLDKAKSLLAASGVSSPEIDLTYSSTQFGDINQTLAQIELFAKHIIPHFR